MNNNFRLGQHNRREFLTSAGGGFGMLGLAGLLSQEGLLAATDGAEVARSPLAPRPGHFSGRAKSVIFLFMYGGPSHIDLFDEKPGLRKHAGKDTSQLGIARLGEARSRGKVMPSPFKLTQHGESGQWVADKMPHLAGVIDEFTVIKSAYCDSSNHGPALFQLNTGFTRVGFPSVGSWVTYGLGTNRQDMPGFIVMYDHRGGPIGGPQNWGSGFLPSTYQATPVRSQGVPILNLQRPQNLDQAQQRGQLDLMKQLNGKHAARHIGESDLLARIDSFELAYRMQSAAPELLDLSAETEETKRLYGIEQGKRTSYFGTQCLMARRLVENGVRFIQLYSGGAHGDDNWDAHGNIVGNHQKHCYDTDQPIAGLIADLKRRGLLDETLVVWGGEFGRTPHATGKGRDHHPFGMTMLMAGGGIKRGLSYGETDEIGYHATIDRASVHDVHATILHQLGLDHTQLTYRHNGRDFRLTDVAGDVIRKIIA
jgi:hypothetical protein